jgi:hypothetical protein
MRQPKFIVQVTTLPDCDDITRFDGIYVPTIYTAPCVMFLMRADISQGEVGWGWVLEIRVVDPE